MSSQDETTTEQTRMVFEESREVALQEALHVIESESYDRVQGFNLLGVVANPRSGGFAASIHHSPHGGRNNSMGHSGSVSLHGLEGGTTTTSHITESSSHSWFGGTSTSTLNQNNNSVSSFDYYSSASIQAQMEITLHQVTEQIDALNAVFEQWSRQYLGTYYYTDEDAAALDYLPPQDLLKGQLQELPSDFVTLNLQTVQDYLETSGKLAHDFYSNKSERKGDAETDTTTADKDNDDDDALMEEVLQSVPDVFFESDFDLTDPKTFCELLVNTTDEGGIDLQQQQQEAPDMPSCLSTPTSQILQLPPPESFSEQLDKVEVALLKQVRSKSSAFFTETNRFGQLKEWIAGLIKDVQRVREVLRETRDTSVEAWELIPALDAKRADLLLLERVLDSALEVSRSKSSIGGLLSAGDDLSAAEQVQYARRLLQEDGVGRLVALSTLSDQLSQYESLVVSNLTEELVEIFLSWKAVSKSSNYSTLSSDSGGALTNGGTSATNLPRTIAETRQRVRDILAALKLCGKLTDAGKAYGNRLNDVIRIAVRTTVEQFNDGATNSSVTANVTSMPLEKFIDCLDMLFEQLLALLKSAVGVNNFCREEGFTMKDSDEGSKGGSNVAAASGAPPPPASTPSSTTSGRVMTATAQAVQAASDLSSKSISELLRLRKETHSLATLEEMKRLWDTCTGFILELEKLSTHKAYGLRSTLLAQAKAFVERQHESQMSALVAALDSERWTQCDVSSERQAALTRLCSGRAVLSMTAKRSASEEYKKPERGSKDKLADAEVEGIRYKVVWSCLLLVEMVMGNVASAACFQALATNVVSKVAELLRLFNSRTTHLVLGAGAIQSAARLKSINAKHLSLVTQCLGMIIAILPHVRAALMAQLPTKQHTLLTDLDKIKKEYGEHNEKVLNKFVTIIGGIVEHGLAPRIANTDFDERTKSSPLPSDGNEPIPCCVFIDGVYTNTEKMHKVLSSLLPAEHLQDVFSRIFAYLDQKVPVLYIAASSRPKGSAGYFAFPVTDGGKRRMVLEVEQMTKNLNGLSNVQPWEFTAMTVLERKMDFELRPAAAPLDETITAMEEEGMAEAASPSQEQSVGAESEQEGVSEQQPAQMASAVEPTGDPPPDKVDEAPTETEDSTDKETTAQGEVEKESAAINGSADDILPVNENSSKDDGKNEEGAVPIDKNGTPKADNKEESDGNSDAPPDSEGNGIAKQSKAGTEDLRDDKAEQESSTLAEI